MEFSINPNQIIETVVDGSFTLSGVIKRYEIAKIIRRFGQWVVTEYGVESLVIQYAISKNRLTGTDWVSHMSEKYWVVLDEFEVALKFALEYYYTEPETMPEILPPPDISDENPGPFVDYYTSKKLYYALLGAHETYRAGQKHIPDNLPRPENAPESLSVKEDLILSPIYSTFAYLLDGFLLCINSTYLLQQFNAETLLELSSKQFRYWIDQVLNQAYENKP